MGFIFSNFSKLDEWGKAHPPNLSPSVAEANELFEPTHSFWAGYATADIGRKPALPGNAGPWDRALFTCGQEPGNVYKPANETADGTTWRRP